MWICTPAVTRWRACQPVIAIAAARWWRARSAGPRRACAGRASVPGSPWAASSSALKLSTSRCAACSRVAPARFCASVTDRATSLSAEASNDSNGSSTARSAPRPNALVVVGVSTSVTPTRAAPLSNL